MANARPLRILCSQGAVGVLAAACRAALSLSLLDRVGAGGAAKLLSRFNLASTSGMRALVGGRCRCCAHSRSLLAAVRWTRAACRCLR